MIYKVKLRISYVEKEFAFNSMSIASEFIRTLICHEAGGDRMEISIYGEKGENDEKEVIDR